MKKSVKIGLWGLVVLCVLVSVATHLLAPRAIRLTTARLIEEATGFEVEVGDMDVSLWKRNLELRDLRLMNPAGFDGGEAVWISRLYAEPTWDAILGKSARFKTIELDIAELWVVQPASGPSNMERLAGNAEVWQEAVHAPKPEAVQAPRPANPPVADVESTTVPAKHPVPPSEAKRAARVAASTDLHIDRLTVRMGVVNVVDHLHGGKKPLTLRHEINREKILTDVTDLDAVSEELLMEFAVNSLMDQFAEPLNELMPGLADELQGFLKQLSQPAPEGEGEGGEGSEDPLDQFKDVLEGLL